MKRIKIILKSDLQGVDLNSSYSIESGYHDGIRHFDHHGIYENNPSPCNNTKIKPIEQGEIYITHLDADTLIGVGRLLGLKVDDRLDLDLLEKIDNNGQSVCKNKTNPTLLFSIGVDVKGKQLNFPNVKDIEENVTSLILELIRTPMEELVELGRKAQELQEKTYKKCKMIANRDTIFCYCEEKDYLNPSRPYEDGFDKVVVYRECYKTISIYANPNSNFEFGGLTIGGIKFKGHPQACGSPRGEDMTLQQAVKVYCCLSDFKNMEDVIANITKEEKLWLAKNTKNYNTLKVLCNYKQDKDLEKEVRNNPYFKPF